MALQIIQTPLYDILPVGQQVIFAVSDNTVVGANFRVKFIAEVYVSNTAITFSSSDLVGSFKTTPNNAGVGIFDFQSVLETLVKPDHEPNSTELATSISQYKGSNASSKIFPIHLIDKYSVNNNAMKYFAIKFKVEYFTNTTTSTITTSTGVNSDEYQMFNGILQYDDVLTLISGNYGYDLDSPLGGGFFPYPSAARFLTNAPYTQYARLVDYGTFAFLNYVPYGDKLTDIVLTYYWNGGSSTETRVVNTTNGGWSTSTANSYTHLMYFGGFPANLQNTSALFATAITNGLTHYTMRSNDAFGVLGATYTINILCPNLKGYEAIRLAWLNQWGVWDYYTFNMKSTRSISTNRTSYTQQGGTWNEGKFKIAGYKGGKKNFRVNSTEKITLNTDFVSESDGVWFEELINSSEVYIINEYDGTETSPYNDITNKYVEPARITNSSYTRKTVANDKLMQYTIEIEKSKMKRTHSA
tara:strand:+ start:667 stop:2079 length:1413 start_codon:yes stop_codon:yes gene_type:complete